VRGVVRDRTRPAIRGAPPPGPEEVPMSVSCLAPGVVRGQPWLDSWIDTIRR